MRVGGKGQLRLDRQTPDFQAAADQTIGNGGYGNLAAPGLVSSA
jgi:hypothetical protein